MANEHEDDLTPRQRRMMAKAIQVRLYELEDEYYRLIGIDREHPSLMGRVAEELVEVVEQRELAEACMAWLHSIPGGLHGDESPSQEVPL